MADPSETTQVSLEPEEPDTAELLDAVRALSAQVGGLQAELQSLRAHGRGLPQTSADAPGWDESTPDAREQTAWMRSLEGPSQRPPIVPRLVLEVVFLVAVAAAAAVAELDPVAIGVLMAAAWILVALAEWAAARAEARHALVSATPLAGASAFLADDPSWFAPPAGETRQRRLSAATHPGDDVTDSEDTQEPIAEAATTAKLPPRADE